MSLGLPAGSHHDAVLVAGGLRAPDAPDQLIEAFPFQHPDPDLIRKPPLQVLRLPFPPLLGFRAFDQGIRGDGRELLRADCHTGQFHAQGLVDHAPGELDSIRANSR